MSEEGLEKKMDVQPKNEIEKEKDDNEIEKS